MNVSLPRLLKSPTGWAAVLMLLGFLYVQWPTREGRVEEVAYVDQNLEIGVGIRWEDAPAQQQEASPVVWALTRRGMHFLVQYDALQEPFETFVEPFVEQDRAAVNGVVEMPLTYNSNYAEYHINDVENRLQVHRFYQLNGQWLKVSVMYKPSSPARVDRANIFLAGVEFIPG